MGSQIAGEGLVEEGFLQLVEGVELVLVEGFKPLAHAKRYWFTRRRGDRGGKNTESFSLPASSASPREMKERFHSKIAGEGLVEEGFLQLVEGVELVLIEGFQPLGFGSKSVELLNC
jgi:hypothetical protein